MYKNNYKPTKKKLRRIDEFRVCNNNIMYCINS